MALSISFGPVLEPRPQLNAVVVFAKKTRGSRDHFSLKKKHPRKKYSPRPYEKADISILYSDNVVVESTPDLVKGCNEHINDYIENRNLSEAQNLFNLMIEKEVEPDAFSYTTLMKGYSRIGNADRVGVLFAEMETKGIIPTVVSFNTAIKSCAIGGDLDGAQSLFDKINNSAGMDPDVYTYNSMLSVCVSARDLETARSLFDEMNSSGIKQDKVTMNTMIDVYAECCDEDNEKRYLEKSRELMEEMELKGVMANERTYSTLLKLCSRGNLSDDSMKILNEMRNNGLRPNVFSYSTVLDGISKDLKLSQEEILALSSRLVDEMKRDRVRPNAATYNSLLNIALRVRDLYRARRLFKEMKILKVDPDVVTYGTMIKCHEKLGDPNDGSAYLKPCLDLLDECEQAGMKMTEEGYTSSLSACANAADLYQASRVWNRLIKNKLKPSVFIYTAMINACLSMDKEDMAFDFFNQMKTSGIKPNVVTWGTFLSYFVKKKDNAGADKICDEMKKHGVKQNKVVSNMLKALSVE